MGSRALLLVKDVYITLPPKNQFLSNNEFLKVLHHHPNVCFPRNCSTTSSGSSLEPLDVPRLAETARISLTPQEGEEFAPKIGQVMEWFGQLQAADLESLEPSIREVRP